MDYLSALAVSIKTLVFFVDVYQEVEVCVPKSGYLARARILVAAPDSENKICQTTLFFYVYM
jgi:hypothetical protein